MSLAAIGAGWALRRNSPRFAYGLMALGPITLATMVPGMVQEQVEVGQKGFAVRTGWFFAPRTYEVKFADVSEIHVSSSTTRRGTNYRLECRGHNDQVTIIPVGALLRQVATQVLETARSAGVDVQGSIGSTNPLEDFASGAARH